MIDLRRAIEFSRVALVAGYLALIGNNAIAQPLNELSDDRQSESTDGKWYGRSSEGWYWYQSRPSDEEQQSEPLVEEAIARSRRDLLYPDLHDTIDPIAELDRIRKTVEEAQARVVLQPTERNVQAWLAVMQQMNARSALFADQMQRTVWKEPQYDYSLVRPTSPAALGAWTAAYNQDRHETIRGISRDYGLYFFISGDCRYCHEFAPYVKRFADAYGFEVLAVTIDGGTVDEFPAPVYSPALANRLGVRTTPALFLARPKADDVRPIAYGMISLNELEERIYRLWRMAPGQVTFNPQPDIAGLRP